MFGFLFWLYFFGILFAVFQDFQKKEVNHFVHLFLLISGMAFIFLESIFSEDLSLIVFLAFALVLMFFISDIFYYGRIFGGGDTKLLFAMTPLFVSGSFYATLINMGVFSAILLFSGAVWGIFFSVFLFFVNFKKASAQFRKEAGGIYLKLGILVGLLFLIFGYFEFLFLFLAGFVFLSVFIFVFSRAIEKAVLTRDVPVSALREGDWLERDVVVGGRKIKSDFNGLSKSEISFLKKARRKIRIKEGLVFVPGFLIALIVYFFREQIFLRIFGF